jgi:hypothetical protein
MKQPPALQHNLFNAPTTETKAKLPKNIQTEPLRSLVQALLTDLITAKDPMAAVASRRDEVKS